MRIDELAPGVGRPLPRNGKTETAGDFRKILDQKVDAGSEISTVHAAGPIDGVFEQGERLLGILDDYAKRLASPAVSLKEISPLIGRIQKEASLLESRSAGIVDTDSELKNLVREMTLTARVAVTKYHRGDFI